MPVIKNENVDLKAKYRIYLKVGLILSLALIIAAFKFSPQAEKKVIISDSPQDIIKVEDVINTVQNLEKPPPLQPPVYITLSNDLPDDPILPDISIDENDIIDKINELPDRHIIIEDEPFYEWADTLPEPIGGLKTLQKKVVYTEIARLAGIEGQVLIEAWIDKEGNVSNAFIVRDIGGGLGDSALDAVLSTKFRPGKQRGIPVNVKVKIPIKFALR